MNFRSRTYLDWLAALAAATTVGLLGCTGDGTSSSSTSSGDDGDFVSDDPSGASGQDKGGAADSEGGTSAGTGTGGGPDPSVPGSGGAAERAITEADIIQVKDGRLYALSQYAGLTIIDISVKDHLTVLGKRALKGIPFEMYLRDGTVYAMFSSWGQYTYDAATKSSKWVQSSHIEALDVTNPAAIGSLGSFELPGDISDSRVVGDVLYAVSYENGYCWGCANNSPRTTVTSIALGNPASIHKVDQLGFSENDPQGYGWRRSISVTPQRMYVAGIEWNGSSEGHSNIQVVDISDPSGHLSLGASVAAKGQITSRWQMDEYNGVLRVVSQPGLWWSNSVPAVQTFTVASSQSLQPLGYMDMTLPKPESLRSVRFDGARAFAITSEQKDPLFTLDLSDPAHPRQAGSLEIPGWIYHMEPRGDRLLALGFDNGNPEGALTVSLFDVADLASPTLLNRVAFGGNWSSVAEDQDRIHKAFTILPDQGLILVPYSGWRQSSGNCGGTYESGIQLVDYSDTTLTKRGVAPSRGQAKRAFLHDDRLFAVADDDVRSFDITNRSAPVKTAALPLATKVDQAIVVSDKVVRLSSDWWTDTAKLEVALAATPGSAAVLGSLDLTSLADPAGPYGGGCYYGYGFYGAKLLAHGTDVYLVYPANDSQKTRVVVISIADPAHPVIAGKITVDAPFYANGVYAGYTGYGGYGGYGGGYYYYGGYGYGETVAPGEGMVQAGSTLVFRRPDVSAPSNTTVKLFKEWLEVVDLSNPTNPKHASTVELPAALGHTPLRIDGTTVLASHWSPLAPNSAKVRFYLDRVNVASSSAPVLLPQVNVPGSLVTFDADSGRLLTVDYKRLPAEMLTYQECTQKYGYGAQFESNDPSHYDYMQPGTCKPIQRSWKLLDVAGSHASLLDTRAFTNDKNNISNVFVGDDRVFAYASPYYYWYGDGDGGGSSSDPYTTQIEIIGGLAGGHLAGAMFSQSGIESSNPVAVAGKRLVLSSYSPPSIDVLDTTNLSALTLTRQAETGSYLESIVVNGDDALCSLGPYGLEVVDLSH